VRDVANAAYAEGLAVDLDCFSPAVAWMVGQDLGALSGHCERIKIMSYGHALGPAGLPFELLALADWLIDGEMAGETEALEWLSQASHLPLPSTRAALREHGLSSEALAAEVRRARSAGIRTLLAGIELVELEGVTALHESQIEADLRAFRAAGADGLALSWDLWHIPSERLDLVRNTWLIEIQEASIEDKPILRNLLELSHHDCSEFNRDDVDDHGLYGYKYLDHYWTEPGRHPFIVRVADKLAGFALVRTIPPGEGRVDYSMAEFFILRKYRRRRIGQVVAHRIFDRFPGRWRVAPERGNPPAKTFWRKAISRYTGGRYVEVQEEDQGEPVYEFDTPAERWHRDHLARSDTRARDQTVCRSGGAHP
jgi:predicted acetyltransferase